MSILKVSAFKKKNNAHTISHKIASTKSERSRFQKNWRLPYEPLAFIIGTSFHLPKMS